MRRLNAYAPLLFLGLFSIPATLCAGEPLKAPSLSPAPPESSSPEGEAADAGPPGKAKKPSLSKNEIAVWTLFSATGAAVIAGGVFGLTALDEQDRYDDNPASVYKHRRDERMIASAVLFGTAGAAAIATIALWAVDRKHRRAKTASSQRPAASFSFDPVGAVRVSF